MIPQKNHYLYLSLIKISKKKRNKILLNLINIENSTLLSQIFKYEISLGSNFRRFRRIEESRIISRGGELTGAAVSIFMKDVPVLAIALVHPIVKLVAELLAGRPVAASSWNARQDD